MKAITILILFFLNLSFGQQTFRLNSDPMRNWNTRYVETDENSKAYYELKGNVKSAFITENYTSNYKKNDSSYSKIINKKQEVYFNQAGYLTKKYLFDKNNKRYLNIKNQYLEDSILIHQKKKYKYLFHDIEKKIYRESDSFHYVEHKYAFNKDFKLTLHTIKSSFQDTFFIKKRNTYNKDGFLVLQENLNNHLFIEEYDSHRCYMGVNRGSYVSEFTYNRKKQLLSKKMRSVNNYRNKIDFYSYSINKYDKRGNRAKMEVYSFKDGKKKLQNTAYFKFNNKNYEIEYYNKNHKTQKVSGKFYEFDEDTTGFLKRKVIGNIKTTRNVKTLLKSISFIYEYNKDGSYQILNFGGSILSNTESYDLHQNFIERKNSLRNVTIKCKYVYDEKGNWIKVEEIENRHPKIYTRTIEYY